MMAAMIVSSFSSKPVLAQATVPRNETVWGAGFGMNTGSYQPWNMGANQAWTTYLMYEPMFGTNVATGEIIGWLGDTIEWQGDDTIQITLRSDLHWTSVGSTLVSNNTPITTDDVIFSFELLQQTGQLGSLVQRVGNISTAFEKVSDTVFNVHILPAYAGSSEVYRQLTYGFLIFPKAVWSQINATKDLSTFTNDWQDTEMVPANWRVASGMYLPYFHDATETIGKVNPNWWGVDDADFGRLPEPKYFGYTSYSSNDLALLAMERGDLDWDGNYLAGLTQVKQEFPNIVTYFDNLPYFPDKSPVMLVPNYHNYPLNQTWLHKAMASVLNYSAMSAVSSGYLKDPSPMLIPADDASARSLLNTTIESEYAITYNVAHATNILEEYCTFDETTGTWWTKEGVTPSDPIQHYPLQEWNMATNTTAPYTILDFMGWTDVNAMDVVAAQAFSSLLHIQTQTELISGWGTVQVRMNNFQFDLANMVMSGQINMNMYERYFQMFSPASSSAGGGVNAPLGGWYNKTFVDDIEALDTYPAGSAQQWAVANEMQEILGQVMPVIPLAGHADWEIYSTTYWENWPNSVTNPMLPSSPFAGTTQNANLLAIVFGLSSTGATATTSGDYTLLIVGAGIAIVAVVVVIVLYMRRRE